MYIVNKRGVEGKGEQSHTLCMRGCVEERESKVREKGNYIHWIMGKNGSKILYITYE